MTRPIRLRLECTRYPHWGRYSGIGQFASRLDPARFRYKIHAASDSDDDLPLPIPSLRRRLRERVQRGGMTWYKLSDFAAELRAFGACLSGQADIVHFLDGEHSGQYLPQWLEKRRRVKLVASYHQPADLLPDLVPQAVAARFDRVVVVSPAQRAYFEAFMPAERIVTILHGIDTDFFAPARPRSSDGIFRCVTAGHWLRDWPTILRVAERLRDRSDIEFHIVTNRETGLEHLPHVRFHQNVSDEQLRLIYQRSDALFLPLTESTANNTLLEGIACGLPVIATDLPSVRAYVSDRCAMLPAMGDVDALVPAIERLKSEEALRSAMGAASRSRAEQLSWAQIGREYQDLYLRLVSL